MRCSGSGSWYPNVPQCAGKLNYTTGIDEYSMDKTLLITLIHNVLLMNMSKVISIVNI